MKILHEHGIEFAIPSLARPACTSYVVISRDTEHPVNEIHDHKRRGPVTNCSRPKESNSIKESCAPNRIKETCAILPSNSISDSLFNKTVILRGERKMDYH